jgi:chorismate dehydratase
MSMPSLRIGAVSYLNTKPLVSGLQEQLPAAELVFDLPSRLADRLAAADLDVALIPTVEYFQDPSYEIVSDACIACRGPVLSVSLLSRCPIAEISSLALDEGSRTSVALVQVLLRERFGITPQLSSLPIGSDLAESTADAVLVIGDRAIDPAQQGFVANWDLGQEWCNWSGLPFVFAMWTARAGLGEQLDNVASALQASRDEGLLRLAEIARQEAGTLGLDAEQCHRYLRDNLYFYLGPQEREGLELFRRSLGSEILSVPGVR